MGSDNTIQTGNGKETSVHGSKGLEVNHCASKSSLKKMFQLLNETFLLSQVVIQLN